MTNKNFLKSEFTDPDITDSGKAGFFTRWLKNEKLLLVTLLIITVLTWLPRLKGPIDLRWDGGVYYILGTALAEGKGYQLLNEPGEIDAVQYPPLLPLIIAGHQLILGTDDPTTVGTWLRYTAFLTFIIYIFAVFKLLKNYLPLHYAFAGTILCLFSLHVYFLSDLCFPEILFSLSTILFILCNSIEKSRSYSVATYCFAVASYALRTVGLAIFVVWVLESLINRRFKQAIVRLALVIIPIASWQIYISSVESGYEYNHPAYSYQRAPYMFYNVSYARNISLNDPFAPEKGEAEVVERIIKNVSELPIYLGESVTTTRGFWEHALLGRFQFTKTIRETISLIIVILLYIIGLAVVMGLFLQFLKKQVVIPVYVLIYLGAICLTPFVGQYLRYLMPVVPFLILFLILFLLTLKNAATHNFSSNWWGLKYFVIVPILIAFLFQLVAFKHTYSKQLLPVEYFDKNNKPIKQRMFFENRSFQAFNLCVNYVRINAQQNDIVAAGTPHWIYLHTGLKAVMPPFESNTAWAHQQLESVPVKYLIIGKDVIGSERYTLPVVKQFPKQWKQVFSTTDTTWVVYQRVSNLQTGLKKDIKGVFSAENTENKQLDYRD